MFWLSFLTVLIYLTLPASGFSAWKSAAESEPRLAVAGPNNQAPYAFMSRNGVYTGFSVDMLREAGESAGINTVLFYPEPLKQSLKSLAKNEIDCIHFVPYSSTLARDFRFAAFYYESANTIFIKSDRYDVIAQNDLRGKKVAIIQNNPVFEKLKRTGDYFIIDVNDTAEGFLKLAGKKVDAYIGERLTSLHYLGGENLEDQFKMLDREASYLRYGVLIKKDRDDLKKLFKQAFQIMEKSGERTRVSQRWFGENVKSQRIYSSPIIRWVMIFIGATLLVSVIVLGWNLLLQRELEIKAIAIEKVNLDGKITEEKIRFEAIVQSLTEGLMLVDPNGVVAYVNAPGTQYLGRRIEDLINHPLAGLYDFLLPKVKKSAVLKKQFHHAEKNPAKPYVIEYTITKTKRMDIRLKFFPVRDRKGHYAGRGVLIEDVTHERELDRLKSEFVSIASHELRTPMTSILGFSEIMITKQLPPDLSRRYTSQIHSEAERLTRILNDMLDLSYLESGESGLEKQSLNMVDLTREVVENFKAQLKDRREIKLDLESQTAELLVDKDKITQVLWNMLSNADKYSPHGKAVLITIRFYNGGAQSEKILKYDGQIIKERGLLLQVTDYGQGIQEEQIAMIFIPFYRVETAVHTIRGTGLGLAIVKRIVEAHGGRVWAESKVKEKTTFNVFFPRTITD